MPTAIKSNLDDLALFGGDKEFDAPLHVGRPNIPDEEILVGRIREVLQRRWLTNSGPLEKEFEARIQDKLDVKHCVAMCNGTVALEIAIRAADLTGEVIVPSYTFVATAHALQWQQITPVFCDIDPNTHNIDPERVEALITPRTTAIIGVHLWGRPCNIEPLEEIAKRRGLRLMFDAAHAFGCSHKGKMVGGFGDAEVFSFHATKFVNCLEGGAVVTNDDELARRMRLMRNFGFAAYDQVDYIGTNGKMNEVCAATGLTSLENIDRIITHNRENHRTYAECLKGLDGVAVLPFDESEECNFQYMVTEVDEDAIGLSRSELISLLHAENVLARRYFWPGCHRMEPYKSLYPHSYLLLPETERVAANVIVMPTGLAMTAPEIHRLCGVLRFIVDNAKSIRERLKSSGDSQHG